MNISNSKDLAFLSTFSLDFPREKIVFIDQNDSDSALGYVKGIYVPDKLFFQNVTTPLPKGLTDDQLLGKLFYANHLPGEPIYPFIRLNEKVLTVREKDSEGLLLYKVGILGKRVAEIYKLKRNGKNTNLITSTLKDYETELSSVSPNLLALINSPIPATGVIRDSLMYQWELLHRVGLGSTSAVLSELLSKWNIKPSFELPLSDNTYLVSDFNLPISGDYILHGANKGIVFIDGKEFTSVKDKPVSLNAGEHEVSLNLEDGAIFDDIINFPNEFIFDNDTSKNWDFEIPDKPKTYYIDFDYRFVEGKVFETKIVQELENENNPSFISRIYKNPDYHGWQHFNGQMSSSPGAKKAILSLTTTKESFCEKLWWGWTKCVIRDAEFNVEIRNLTLRQLNLPALALV